MRTYICDLAFISHGPLLFSYSYRYHRCIYQTRRLSDVYRTRALLVMSPRRKDRSLRFLFRPVAKESRSLSRSRSRSRLDLDIEITNATAHAWIMHGTVRDPDGMSWVAEKYVWTCTRARVCTPVEREISRKGKGGRTRDDDVRTTRWRRKLQCTWSRSIEDACAIQKRLARCIMERINNAIYDLSFAGKI